MMRSLLLACVLGGSPLAALAQEPIVHDGYVERADGARLHDGADSLALNIVGAGPAASRRLARAGDEPGISTPTVFLAASLGSAGGFVLGALLGYQLGIGGGDDPGLAGTVLGALVGSIAGTAMGVDLATAEHVPRSTAITAGVVGLVGGFVGGRLVGEVFNEPEAWFLGFSLGQGAVATAVTSLIEH